MKIGTCDNCQREDVILEEGIDSFGVPVVYVCKFGCGQQKLNTMIFQDKSVSISTTFKRKALRAEFKPYKSSVVMDFWVDDQKIEISDQDEDEQCVFVRMVKEYLKGWCKNEL